jgi:hypothetical protein
MNDSNASNSQKLIRKGSRYEILQLLKEAKCFDYSEEDLHQEYIRLYCRICRSDVVIDRILRIRKHIETNKHQKNAIRFFEETLNEQQQEENTSEPALKRIRSESSSSSSALSSSLNENTKIGQDDSIASQNSIKESINSRLINENLYLRGSLELEKKKNEYLNCRINEFSESFKLFFVYFKQFSTHLKTQFDFDQNTNDDNYSLMLNKTDDNLNESFGSKFQIIEKDLEFLKDNLFSKHEEIKHELNDAIGKKEMLLSKLNNFVKIL